MTIAAVGWDWWQFIDDGGTALIGGLAGGGIAAWVAIRQTRTTLRHDAEQAREAAKQEREANRHLLDQQAYLELLEILGETLRLVRSAGLANPRRGHRFTYDETEEVRVLFKALRRGSEVLTVLLPRKEGERWQSIERLMIELRQTARWAAGSVPPAGESTYRDEEHRVRSEADVEAYCEYVRLTLLALLDGRPIPPDQLPPVIQRLDGSVWDWPTRQSDENAAIRGLN